MLNIPISNVPGPREPGRVGGAFVTEIYSVGPLTTGSGLNITVWSYVDQLNISVLSDGATLKTRTSSLTRWSMRSSKSVAPQVFPRS